METLFLSQCNQRIDFGSAPRRNMAGKHCHYTQQHRDGRINHGIVRLGVRSAVCQAINGSPSLGSWISCAGQAFHRDRIDVEEKTGRGPRDVPRGLRGSNHTAHDRPNVRRNRGCSRCLDQSKEEFHYDFVILVIAKPDLAGQTPALAEAEFPVESPCADIREADLNHEFPEDMLVSKLYTRPKKGLADAAASSLRPQECAQLSNMIH